MNLLFVCSRNKWRSRTAEDIFKNNGHHIVKSAGTESTAQVRINHSLINWADTIFVMEQSHKKRLVQEYEETVSNKKIIVLDIPDGYQYMDEELIELLKISIKPFLKELVP